MHGGRSDEGRPSRVISDVRTLARDYVERFNIVRWRAQGQIPRRM